MSHCFKTPSSSRTTSRVGACTTPRACIGSGKEALTIPASPAMKKMGFGTGVTVFLYERHSPNRGKFGSPWAVKKINSKLRLPACASNKDKSNSPIVKRTQTIEEMCNSRLAAEAKLLRNFKHPNIIGFRDYTTAADGTKCLAMESGERDLYSIIEDLVDNEETDPLPAAAVARVCQDVSSALCYLHEEQRLVHGDIKSANLLIKGDFKQVKLCDFGVSLKLDKKMVALPGQCYIGTECWSPPEAVSDTQPITDRADVFAFGLTIWECLTLDSPHVHVLNSEEDEEFLSEDEQIIRSEQREALFQQLIGTRPLLPTSVTTLGAAYTPFLESFYHCTHAEPSERPSASQLVQIFSLLDLSNTHNKEEICAEVLANRTSEDIDRSVDSGDESLNSSYFTNETLALKSNSLDLSEQDSENEKSHYVISSGSITDASRDAPELKSCLDSCEGTNLLVQEDKTDTNGSRTEVNVNANLRVQLNEAAVTTPSCSRRQDWEKTAARKQRPSAKEEIQITTLD